MRFPNAQKGVQNMYTATILALIAALCVIVTGIGLAIAAASGSIGIGGVSLIFTIASAVLLIIGLIIMIVGLSKAQKDDNYFRVAFFCVLASLVFSIVSAFLTASPVVAAIFTFLSGIASTMVTFFSVKGVENVAEQLGDTALASRANKLLMMLVVILGVGVVLSFVSGLLRGGTALTVAGILAILAGIAEIVAFFIYLGLLKRAKEAFKA